MILLPFFAAALVAEQADSQPSPAPAPTAQIASEDGFKVGVDTLATVSAKLGKPNSTEANSDGTVTIRYISVHTSVKGASFIPVVGLFAGGAKGKSLTKAFTFGVDGLLKSYSSINFQTDCKAFSGCH